MEGALKRKVGGGGNSVNLTNGEIGPGTLGSR